MTKLLQIPQKSGLNQNNIMVASATKQQIQSRALDPGDILLGIPPLIATVDVYQVAKTSGTVSHPTYPCCDANNRVFCKITANSKCNFKTLTKALLTIPQNIALGDQTAIGGDFSVYRANANFVESSMPTNTVQAVVQNGTTYAVIDISDYLKSSESQTIYIAIQSDEGRDVYFQNAGSVEVLFVEDDDFIPTGKLEKEVGSRGGYAVNARNGKLHFSQHIYGSKGGLMPFDLSMTYNAANCSSSSANGISNGVKGWMFNYQQSLKAKQEDMLYLDAGHVLHTFKHPTNNDTVWYDASGKNGLVLVQTSTGYSISDGKTMTLNFDTSKRLVSIVEKLSSTSNLTTSIEYSADGKISKVTDGNGDVYNFVWTATLVTIKKADTVIAEITLANEQIAQLKYSQSGDTVNFEYNTSDQLISVTDSASHQKTVFEYINNGSVSEIKNYIRKPVNSSSTTIVESVTDSYFLEYGLLQTKVAMSRNTAVKANAYSTMVYAFAEDGELINSAEQKAGEIMLAPIRGRTKEDFKKSSGSFPDTCVAQATFSGSETTITSATKTSDTFTVNASNQVFDTYMFSAVAKVSLSNNISNDGSQRIYLEILKGTQVLGTADFDVSKRESEMVSGIIKLPKANNSLNARLVLYNIDAEVQFGYVKIYSTNRGAQLQCIDVNTGNTQASSYDGSASKTWYEQDYCNLQCGSTTVQNVVFNYKDFMLTTISRLQNPSAFNVWYNDGKNMFYQVSSASLVYNGVAYNIANVTVCTMSSTLGRSTFEYIVPYSSYLYKARKVTTGTNSTGAVAEEIVNSKFQTVQVKDEKGIVTEYEYNDYGSVTKKKIKYPSSTLMNIEEETTYTTKNLPSTSKETRYYTTYTHTNSYGTDYQLEYQIDAGNQTTTYEYVDDSNDKVSKIYSTLSGTEHKNLLTYDGDLVGALSDGSTQVTFGYDGRDNINLVNIAGTPVLSKVITYNASGTTQSVTTYGNGQKIKKYYDKYDRLIKVSDCTNTETVLVKYIYSDNEVAGTVTEPTDSSLAISANSQLRVVIDSIAGTRTVYTYDQFGQVVQTSNSKIAKTISKDSYGRASSAKATISSDELTNNYTYKNFYSDELASESAVAKISNVQSTITTTYTKDTLGRPTETRVVHGSYGHKYVYSYIPRQTRTWVEDDGPIAPPIFPTGVAPTALGGYWQVTDKGTTQYVAQFQEYTLVNGNATSSSTYTVEYDANGNITKYGDVTYEYDKLNRLIRENNPALDKTIIWSYNALGNRTEVREYAYTTATSPTGGVITAYIYGNDWKQLIVLSGTTTKTISYDSAGNPTNYKGATLTWTRGRLLASYKPSGSSYTTTMQYDANGIRCSKTIPTSTQPNVFRYVYDGNNLVRETKSGTSSYTKTFLYNSQGIIGFAIGSTVYTYRKNLFGDIIAIYQGATKKAAYLYDAWGNCTITQDTDGIGTANPFRYRGYYWDNDLQLYYLMSRYYDPATGRFINADSLEYLDPETIGGLNLYAYCGNNPVMHNDAFGNDWNNTWWGKMLIGLGIVVTAVAFAAAVVASAGTVAAVAGTAAATIGLSAATVSTVATVASIATTTVGVGIAAFGVSDAIEVWSGGLNPIRDWVLEGDQNIYNNNKSGFNIAGSVATLIGTVGPSIIKGLHPQVNFGGHNTPMSGQPSRSQLVNNRRDGYQINFYDANGNWNLRWDAYTQDGHSNPHVHYDIPGSYGSMLGIWWWIKKLIGK
ncbi:MAG: RHS repeat-associated core domain-containing protein [Clostridia bacterium]|nr:RHS repeat-associated core domain-containing protein [Clostridia bacterium]